MPVDDLENKWDQTALFCPAKLPAGYYGKPVAWLNGRRWSAANFSTSNIFGGDLIGLERLCAYNGNPNGNLGGMVSPFAS